MTARALKKRNNMATIFGLSKNLGKGMDLKRSEIKGLKLTNKPKFTLKSGSNNPNRQEVSGVKKATIGSALKGVHDKLQDFGKRHSAWKAKRKAASVGEDGLTNFQRTMKKKKEARIPEWRKKTMRKAELRDDMKLASSIKTKPMNLPGPDIPSPTKSVIPTGMFDEKKTDKVVTKKKKKKKTDFSKVKGSKTYNPPSKTKINPTTGRKELDLTPTLPPVSKTKTKTDDTMSFEQFKDFQKRNKKAVSKKNAKKAPTTTKKSYFGSVLKNILKANQRLSGYNLTKKRQ